MQQEEPNKYVKELTQEKYKYGFTTDVHTDIIERGLNEDVVRLISEKKGEPEWLLEFRLKAYRHWLTLEMPTWAHLRIPEIDYQAISYYADPTKKKEGPKSMDEVDPELIKTFNKLGIPLEEQMALSGMAVDAVMDSVSVKTTFKETLMEKGIIFCSFSEAVHEHPDLVQKYLGSVVPYRDNFFAALNSAVFSDGSFVYIPKGVRCPMELSTYFRINARNTGQFERTLIVADDDSYVSYLEVLEEFDGSGETAPILERYRTIPRRTRKTAFGYPAFAPEEAEHFQKYLNKEISKVFAPELVVPDFAWEIATPWQSLLDSGTAADLKILIKENKLPVNVYLRKAELEKGIIKEAGKSDFWENIMQTMGITEYFQVKELCIQGSKFVNGDAVDTTFPVLSRNRLVDENYWYRTILAKEFMEFFENWLGSGKEREYIKDHAEQTCFLAACRLYGFADRELVTEFYKIMCPEQNAAERVGNFWKQAMQCALQYNIKKIVGMEVYYDSQSVSSNSVKLLYRSFLTSDRFHYVPTKAEIEDIAISGIGFSEKDREALIDMMERKYRCERTNGRFIVGELEKAIHTGIPVGELTGYLQKVLLSGRRSSYLGDIMEILERAQRTVRKISLGGYTETEINRAVTKKKAVRVEKKIYPNDPCPCGSGKKYKNCCGRR